MSDREQQTIEALSEDFERVGRRLSYAHVDRVIDKRGLTPEESVLVYEVLSKRGIIEVTDSVEVTEDIASFGEPAGDDRDSVTALLQATSEYKLLRPQEEIELGRVVRLARDIQEALDGKKVRLSTEAQRTVLRGAVARQKLILSNIRLVVSIAVVYRGMSDLPLSDLVQEGMFGLMEAVHKFDYTLGFRFSTYATWWIRQSVTRAMANTGSLVRLPVHRAEEVNRLKRAYRFLERVSGGRPPTMEDLADELLWSVDKTHFLFELARTMPVSIDAPVRGTDDLSLGETLISSMPGPEDEYQEKECAKAIRESLDELTPREKLIVALRFGLDESGQELTLDNIGKRLGVTRERIRQIEAKSLRRLKLRFERRGLQIFLGLPPNEGVSPPAVPTAEEHRDG